MRRTAAGGYICGALTRRLPPGWQRFMILITLVLTTLLTSIWCAAAVAACNVGRRRRWHSLFYTLFRFYYSRGANCCTEIRTILDCDPVGPCLGYEGDCEVFVQQFAGVQGSYLYSDGPGEPPTEHEYIDDYGALFVLFVFRDAREIIRCCCIADVSPIPTRLGSMSRFPRRRLRDGPVFRGPHLRRRGAAGGHVPRSRL